MNSPEKYRNEITNRALARMNRAINVFGTFIESSISVEDELGLMSGLCKNIVEVAGHRLTSFGATQHDEAKTLRSLATHGCGNMYLEVAEVTWIHTVRERTLNWTSIRTENASVVRDSLTEPWCEHLVSQRHCTVRRGSYTWL